MNQQEIVNLFSFIVGTLRVNNVPTKTSLVYHRNARRSEEWYVLIDGTWKIESMEDWQRYGENHGQLTPLH